MAFEAGEGTGGAEARWRLRPGKGCRLRSDDFRGILESWTCAVWKLQWTTVGTRWNSREAEGARRMEVVD